MPHNTNELISTRYGKLPGFYVEYVKRAGPYTMDSDHFHSYYEIYYMLSGESIYFVKDRTYKVVRGDLVFIPPRELHKTMYAGEAEHERLIIHFDDELLNRMFGDQTEFMLLPFRQEHPVLHLPIDERLAMDQQLRLILSEMERQDSGYPVAIAQAVTAVMLGASRYLEHNKPLALPYETRMHSKIFEVVRYINRHYMNPIRLDALADHFYISPYYLSRKFKEVTGFSFSDYLILTRVKEAQRLLRESTLSITEIAAEVGFDNFSHFGKTFKKITKQAPRDYRNHRQLG